MVRRKNQKEKCAARKPHFFKVLLGDFAQRLKIPVNFMKHISMRSSKRASLRGPSGRCWCVQLRKTVKGMFLCGGWSKFVKDHALKEYEFLVFGYDGDMRFSVQIFDTSACEREDVFNIQPRERLALSEEQVKCPSVVRCLFPSQAVKTDLEEGSVNNGLQYVSFGAVQGSGAAIKTEGNDLQLCVLAPPSKQHKKGYTPTRRPVTEEEISKTQEAANSFTLTLKFPYAVIRIRAMHIYQPYTLRLPNSFSHCHLPRIKMNMVLRDPKGKAWVVSFIPGSRDTKERRDRLSAGWYLFVRGNNLEIGDHCVFELVGPVEFRVHIFRVADEITPSMEM